MDAKKTGALVFILAAAIVLLVLLVLEYTASKHARDTNSKPLTKVSEGKWAVLGTGIGASAVVYYLNPLIRSSTAIREASNRFGGRVLSQPPSLTPMNTRSQALELGGWVFDTFGHTYVKQFLLELQVPTLLQIFMPNQSFTYFGGTRGPWPAVPTIPADMMYGDVPQESRNAWLAHTGIPVDAAPTASAKAVWNLIIPITAAAVTGLGWLSVPFRAVQNILISYGQQLNAIESSPDGKITLRYTSGDVENVEGAVLTCPPGDLTAIKGILPSTVKCINDSLLSFTQGVLYAQWTASTVWWPQTGFQNAVAATDTPLGRIATADAGTLRCKITGPEFVNYWTDLIVKSGSQAAASQVGSILSTVFGVLVPPPTYVSFRGWPNSLYLWKYGVNRDAVRNCVLRPCGRDVKVWWSSGDVSNNQGWYEGAVEAAVSTAKAVNDVYSK